MHSHNQLHATKAGVNSTERMAYDDMKVVGNDQSQERVSSNTEAERVMEGGKETIQNIQACLVLSPEQTVATVRYLIVRKTRGSDRIEME